ncbi:MAG: hypothetical protein IJR42_06705 [Paludibacteraceae bacterium]|nr:hypothetical protein [Paludibacteraceae bacterium]
MKKIFTLCVVTLVALSMSAKPYNHSIGVVAGSGIGVQFKTMVMDNFTIIEEFGYLGSLCAAGDGFNMSTLGAVDNLVLAYQAKAAEGQGIELDWFVGGQIKAGFLGGNLGTFGAGAAAGIEAVMQNAPIAFSFDFRPGYGCILVGNGGGNVGVGHVFDWTLNLGVRYKF